VILIVLFSFILENRNFEALVLVFITLHDIVLFFRPHELDFKYVMKVSSLKERLPEAAFKKQNYMEHKGLFRCHGTLRVLSFVPVVFHSLIHTHACTHTFSPSLLLFFP